MLIYMQGPNPTEYATVKLPLKAGAARSGNMNE
jgi:hypothetical protein